jgi:hypothetical protein
MWEGERRELEGKSGGGNERKEEKITFIYHTFLPFPLCSLFFLSYFFSQRMEVLATEENTREKGTRRRDWVA